MRCHISTSKACFAADSDLGFEEIHVGALPGNVMVGAEGGAGLAPDVRHPPQGRTNIIYHNYGCNYNRAASIVVKAAGWYERDPGFKTQTRQYFAFICYVHRHMNLYA